MILYGEGLIADKGTFEGVSEKTNRPYKFYHVYVKEAGLVHKLQVNERIYNKAEKEKKYRFAATEDNYGKLQLNDIELVK